jgi:multidrug efflux pump subunit AcrB
MTPLGEAVVGGMIVKVIKADFLIPVTPWVIYHR